MLDQFSIDLAHSPPALRAEGDPLSGQGRSRTGLEVIRQALAGCEDFHPRVAPANLCPDHRLVEDIGLDSVALLDLALELETILGRAVDEADLARLGTVGDLMAFLGAR